MLLTFALRNEYAENKIICVVLHESKRKYVDFQINLKAGQLSSSNEGKRKMLNLKNFNFEFN